MYKTDVSRLQMFEVLNKRCAEDLDSAIGEKLVIADISTIFKNGRPIVDTQERDVLFWSGTGWWHTNNSAISNWVNRGGLRMIAN